MNNIAEAYIHYDTANISIETTKPSGDIFLKPKDDLIIQMGNDLFIQGDDGIPDIFMNQNGNINFGKTNLLTKLIVNGDLSLSDSTGRINFFNEDIEEANIIYDRVSIIAETKKSLGDFF